MRVLVVGAGIPMVLVSGRLAAERVDEYARAVGPRAKAQLS